jgi:2-polyprenyl-3-methyl-5-hydroxy-6-metoxy-1,4-benzoquinol methylase
MTGWWTSFFDQTYAHLGLEARDEAARERVVDTIIQLLGVTPRARIFDQCCGIGRLSVPLARRGYRTTSCGCSARQASPVCSCSGRARCRSSERARA